MRILIAGAGIGGLTAALALQRSGHLVEVYESTRSIEPVGAGIWLAPNGQEVLRRIDEQVLREVHSAGLLMDEALITDADGRMISRIDARAFQHRYATSALLAIRRFDLHRILHDALAPGTVRFGHRLVRYEAGTGVQAHFDNGMQACGDLLIGADGIHSRVRSQLIGTVPLRYSGQTCWRGLSPVRIPSEWGGKGVEIWGREAGRRVGFSQVSTDESYYYVTALAPSGGGGPEWAVLMRHLDGFPAIVRELVDATPPERIIRSDLNDITPLKCWTHGRVALLGDAAHPTLPNLGQGANQAMESALALAHSLRGVRPPDVEAALRSYQRLRIGRATHVVTASWRIGRMVNVRSRWVRKVRDAAMSRMPDAVSRRQLHRIFDVPADWRVR